MSFESGRTPAAKPVFAIRNELLLGIKPAALGEHARVFLRHGAVLASAGEPIDDVYFIESGLASAMTRHGLRDVDVAMTGSEGMVGYECLLGARRASHTTVMRFEGSAIRMPASSAIRLKQTHAQFDERALSFVCGFCKQLAENCAANALLSIESRLARWLLSASERLGSKLTITHDVIASAVGARRAGVTVAIHILEGTKAIKSTRASLSVLDREQLAEVANSRRI
jgi:CRP-like cAMP-binding protein